MNDNTEESLLPANEPNKQPGVSRKEVFVIVLLTIAFCIVSFNTYQSAKSFLKNRNDVSVNQTVSSTLTASPTFQSIAILSPNYAIIDGKVFFFPPAETYEPEYVPDISNRKFGGKFFCNTAGPFSCLMDVLDAAYILESLINFEIVGADPQTFVLLFDDDFMSTYAKDKRNVYYAGIVIPNADLSTIVYDNGLVRDSKQIYCGTSTRDSIDIDTLVYVHDSLWKDKNAIYIDLCNENGPLNIQDSRYLVPPEGVVFDVATFTHVSGFYKDKNGVYVISSGPDADFFTTVEEADPKTFEVIEGMWARDADSVFYRYMLIKGMDPDTLNLKAYDSQSNNSGYVRDATNVYLLLNGKHGSYRVDKVVGSDPDTFVPLGYGPGTIADHNYEGVMYSKDKNHVYEDYTIITGAEPTIFVMPKW